MSQVVLPAAISLGNSQDQNITDDIHPLDNEFKS